MTFNIDPIGIRTSRERRLIVAPLLCATAFLGAPLAAAPAPAPTALTVPEPAPAPPETLMDAVNAAYDNNPTLAEQRYRQKSTNESYVQTRAQYGPSVSATASASYNYTRLHQVHNSNRIGDGFLTLRQEVYSGGRLRGALEQARANVRASEEQLRRVEGEVVQSVIGAYSAVLRDERKLDVARENVIVLQQQLDERRYRRKVRDVTITDVAQSDTAANSSGSSATNPARLRRCPNCPACPTRSTRRSRSPTPKTPTSPRRVARKTPLSRMSPPSAATSAPPRRSRRRPKRPAGYRRSIPTITAPTSPRS